MFCDAIAPDGATARCYTYRAARDAIRGFSFNMKFCGAKTFSTQTFSGQWNSLNSPQLISTILLMSSSSPEEAEASGASSLKTPLSSASAHRLLLKSTKREASVDIRRTRKACARSTANCSLKTSKFSQWKKKNSGEKKRTGEQDRVRWKFRCSFSESAFMLAWCNSAYSMR